MFFLLIILLFNFFSLISNDITCDNLTINTSLITPYISFIKDDQGKNLIKMSNAKFFIGSSGNDYLEIGKELSNSSVYFLGNLIMNHINTSTVGGIPALSIGVSKGDIVSIGGLPNNKIILGGKIVVAPNSGDTFSVGSSKNSTPGLLSLSGNITFGNSNKPIVIGNSNGDILLSTNHTDGIINFKANDLILDVSSFSPSLNEDNQYLGLDNNNSLIVIDQSGIFSNITCTGGISKIGSVSVEDKIKGPSMTNDANEFNFDTSSIKKDITINGGLLGIDLKANTINFSGVKNLSSFATEGNYLVFSSNGYLSVNSSAGNLPCTGKEDTLDIKKQFIGPAIIIDCDNKNIKLLGDLNLNSISNNDILSIGNPDHNDIEFNNFDIISFAGKSIIFSASSINLPLAGKLNQLSIDSNKKVIASVNQITVPDQLVINSYIAKNSFSCPYIKNIENNTLEINTNQNNIFFNGSCFNLDSEAISFNINDLCTIGSEKNNALSLQANTIYFYSNDIGTPSDKTLLGLDGSNSVVLIHNPDFSNGPYSSYTITDSFFAPNNIITSNNAKKVNFNSIILNINASTFNWQSDSIIIQTAQSPGYNNQNYSLLLSSPEVIFKNIPVPEDAAYVALGIDLDNNIIPMNEITVDSDGNLVINVGKKNEIAFHTSQDWKLSSNKALLINSSGQLTTSASSNESDCLQEQPIDFTEEDFLDLKAYYYYNTENKLFEYGLMAEEVAENPSFNDLVIHDKNNVPQTIDYESLLMIMIHQFIKTKDEFNRSRQELERKIEKLEALKKRFSEIEKKIKK